ncbi:endonuclease/exonuclease/phosphatase family protein [Streptomyces sp. NPDC003027]
MKRLACQLAALCALLFAGVTLPAGEAHAAEAPPPTAGHTYALRSEANGMFVAAEINAPGAQAGKLRARTAGGPEALGSWEKFTLHTADKGATVALRSEANGLYVTTEVNYGDPYAGLLRARGATVGDWQGFRLEPQSNGTYALKSKATGAYVTAEINDSGGDQAMLRARATSVGSWERFEIVDLGAPGGADRPAPRLPATAEDFKVMTWNVCAGTNDTCGNHRVTGDALADQVVARLGAAAADYDAVFLQEMCETHARTVETRLEAATNSGWHVRFAPIRYTVDGSELLAARNCAKAGTDGNWTDRGAYGIGLAVPAESTWYRAEALTSPPNQFDGTTWTRKEQRTVLCATIEARALQFCNAHFSSGLTTDDSTGSYREAQAAQLESVVHARTPAGYRTVFGGDLNVVPPDSTSPDGPKDALKGLYAADRECDEGLWPERPRDGRATKPLTGREIKIDYIFAPAGAQLVCDVTADAGRSDHYPVTARVRLTG